MSSIDDSKCYIGNFNLGLVSRYLAFLHPLYHELTIDSPNESYPKMWFYVWLNLIPE